MNATQAQDSQDSQATAATRDTPLLLQAGLIGRLAQIDQVQNSSLRSLIDPDAQTK